MAQKGTAVGALAIRVLADTTDFVSGMKTTGRPLQRMRRQMGRVAKRAAKMSAALAAAGAAITAHLVRKGMKAVDQQAKFARMIGISTRELIGLQHAAEVTAGVTDEQLNMALQRMTRRIAEAAVGTGEAQQAIKDLGFDAEKLQRAGPAEAFREISDAIQNVESREQRLRMAFKLFDSEGAKLVNTLSAGREEIERLFQEASDIGLAFDDIDARKVEAANDAMTRLNLISQSVSTQMAIAVAPRLEQVATEIFNAAKETENFDEAIQEMTNSALDGIAKSGIAISRMIQFIEGRPEMAQFGAIGFMLFGRRGAALGAAIGAAFDVAQEELAKLGIGIDDTAGRMGKLKSEIDDLALGEKVLGEGLMGEERMAELERLRNNLDALKDVAGDDAMQAFTDMFGSAEEGATSLGQQLENLFQTLLDSRDAAEESAKSIQTEQERASQAAEERQAAEEEARRAQLESRLSAIQESLMSESEMEQAQHEKRLEHLKDARDAELVAEQEYRETKEELEAKHQQRLNAIEQANMSVREKFEKASWDSRVATVAGHLQSMTSTVSASNKEMFRINKAAALADAGVQAYQGIQKTWNAYPYPWNIPMTAAHAAAAFSNIRRIQSQSFSGGATTAPSVAASTPAGSTPVTQTGGGSEPERVIRLEGVSASSLFSGEQVTALAKQIEEAAGDGRTRIMVAA